VVKLQALGHHIFSPTTAIIDYATDLEKLSAKGQYFVGAQMAVGLYGQLKLYQAFLSFVTIHVAYASTDITKII